jgi:hypothetical protein
MGSTAAGNENINQEHLTKYPDSLGDFSINPDILTSNPFAALAEPQLLDEKVISELEPPVCAWKDNQPSVDKVSRIMDQMSWWYEDKGEVWQTPPEEDYNTDSAASLKRHLMYEWRCHRHDLRRAGAVRWAENSALWGRVSLHRLRFLGRKQWYMVVLTSGGDQRERLLVLAVPPTSGSLEEKTLHAQRQMTFNDTEEDLFAPGQRISKAVRGWEISAWMKSGLTGGFEPRHRHHPVKFHGKNYGGMVTMPDKGEAQLAKERGLYSEGPLHYVPWVVTPLNLLYYPEKDKARIIHDCAKSKYNDSLEDAGGAFDGFEHMLSALAVTTPAWT